MVEVATKGKVIALPVVGRRPIRDGSIQNRQELGGLLHADDRTAACALEHRAHDYLMRGSTMPRSITIEDVDDTTASWLVEEAGRRGVSVESVAGHLLQRGLEWERRRAALPT